MKFIKKYYLDKLFTGIFTFLLLSAIISNLIIKNWFNVFISLVSLIISYLPYIIAKNKKILIPPGFQVLLILFIYSSIYLGELKSFYFRYWWWDKMLHTLSGIILGFIGFIIAYILNREENINLYMSPAVLAIFSFTFGVSLGTLWEIFEFTMDNMLGFTMQRFGLVDTMWDLIVDTIGALIASVTGYLYLINNEPTHFHNIMNRLIKNFKVNV